MDCPKCVGKLQAHKIQTHSVEYISKQTHAGRNWGAQVDKIDKESAKVDNLVLDRCFACEGVWFDKGELAKMKKLGVQKSTLASHAMSPNLHKKLNEKGGLCPCCKVPMRKIKGKKGMRNVTVDACGKCKGLWLDGGEVNYAIKGTKKEKFVNIFRYLWGDRFIPAKGYA
ncbi:zf-TFIIB domain-containing protein [Candidatus Omnitrophota bacterium]